MAIRNRNPGSTVVYLDLLVSGREATQFLQSTTALEYDVLNGIR
jgi:hypothetical protein